MDLPEFDGGTLVKLHNQGFTEVVDRLLAGASRDERARERDRFVQLAGTLLGGDGRLMAGALHRRMVELSRSAAIRLVPVKNPGSVDHALTCALIVAGFEVPHRTTIGRALTRRRPIVHSAPAVHSQIAENAVNGDHRREAPRVGSTSR
jgi:hypothetical protein